MNDPMMKQAGEARVEGAPARYPLKLVRVSEMELQAPHYAVNQEIATEVFAQIVRESLNVVPDTTRRAGSGTQPTSIVTFLGEDKNRHERVAVKLFMAQLDGAACFERELAAYKILAAGGLEEALSRLPRLKSAGSLLGVDGTREQCHGQFIITKLVSGDPFADFGKISETVRLGILKNVGAFMGLLHQTKVTNPDLVPSTMHWATLRDKLMQHRNRIIDGARDGGASAQDPMVARTCLNFGAHNLAKIAEFLDSSAVQRIIAEPPAELPLCHGDLHRSHVFVKTDATGALVFNRVIDLADAGFYDVGYEFATVYLDLCGGNPRHFAALLEAYKRVAGVPAIPSDLVVRMKLYTMIHVFDVLEARRCIDKVAIDQLSFDEIDERLWAPLAAEIDAWRTEK